MKKMWLPIITTIIVAIIIVLIILKKTNHLYFNNLDTYKVVKVEDRKDISGKGIVFPEHVKVYKINKNIGEYIRPQIKDFRKVKKGTPLIYYDTNSSNRPNLVDNINNVKEDLNRDYQNVAKHNSSSYQKQISNDYQRLFKAQQKLNQHDNLSSKDIYAAFNGEVKFSNSISGKNGDEILKLVSTKSVIKMRASQYIVNKIKKGSNVNFKLDSDSENVKGKVQSIDNLPINMKKERYYKNYEPKYMITISDLNHGVRAGFTGKVTIPYNMIEIPQNSIINKNYVFIVNKDNYVQKRRVKIVKIKNKLIAKKGLKLGDRVIEKPKRSLQEGQQINIK